MQKEKTTTHPYILDSVFQGEYLKYLPFHLIYGFQKKIEKVFEKTIKILDSFLQSFFIFFLLQFTALLA